MKFKLHYLGLLLLASACMNHPVQYEYSDGSANVYVIQPAVLKYIPVKPEESSTGFYSGGEPKTVTLTPAQYKTLQELFENAFVQPQAHMQDRIKTSGLVSSISGDEKKQCILKPKSAELIAIEAALAAIIQK